ncbi:MAG: hypothetical protein NVSMB40_11830 [Aquirhabdus sp.]
MINKQPKRSERIGVDRMGRSPLHYAASTGNTDEVSRLLSDGINVNAVDDNGWSSLHFAAQANSVEVATQLISMGAEVNAIDSNGNSPLFKAVFNSQGNGDLIKILRSAGANPYIENNHGVSPISLARNIGNFNVAQYFDDLN